MKRYMIVARKPLARFWYQGNHTHPVRREVLVIRETKSLLVGYEVAVGKQVVPKESAGIKSYRKAKIASYGQYCRIREARKNRGKDPTLSTLERRPLIDHYNRNF